MEVKKLIPVVLAIATVVVHVVFAIWASNAQPYISGSCGFLGDPVCPEDMDPEAVDIYGRLVLWGMATAVLFIIWWSYLRSAARTRRQRRRAEASRVARRTGLTS